MSGSSGGCVGGGDTSASCGDVASIQVVVTATDDRTTAPEMGYRLSLASGSPPAGLTLPSKDVRADSRIGFFLYWNEATGQESVDFELRIRSVDRAGNASATGTVVRVRSDGEGGCAVAHVSRGERTGSLWFIANGRDRFDAAPLSWPSPRLDGRVAAWGR